MDLARAAFFHIADGVAYYFAEVVVAEFGHAADFGETACNGVESVDVFAYFGQVGFFEGFALKVVGPSAEGRDGSAELVCCFFGHAYPYAVFLFTTCCSEEVVGDEEQENGEEEIDERYDAQHLEQGGAFVVDVGEALVGKAKSDGSVLACHVVEFVLQTLRCAELVGADVARAEDAGAAAVDDDDGDEDAIVGDFGEEGAVEVIEHGSHVAVNL